MSFLLLEVPYTTITNTVLVMVLLFLGYLYLETFWSYKINKPFAWEKARKENKLSKELIKTERLYRDKVRFYNLWFQVNQLNKNNIPGAFAELGVHLGKTAKAIHLMDDQRDFYLFDTFTGFDQKDLDQETQNDERFSTKMFADANLDKVKKYINGNEHCKYRPGFFPDTARGLENEIFSLVHIDADLYAPTIDALRFFYPRLSPGGIIIVHDYNHNWDGIPKALHEFMPTIPESLVELPDWQGSAMIVKGRNEK